MSPLIARRVVVGAAPAAPGGIALMVLQFRRLCGQLGYPNWTEINRSPESSSRYVRVMAQVPGWPLKIRISDHEIWEAKGCDFELVTRDGRSGGEHLSAFIHAVARGEVQ